jgi:hypothetical protein
MELGDRVHGGEEDARLTPPDLHTAERSMKVYARQRDPGKSKLPDPACS